MYVLHPQVQQGQKHYNGFLLIPGDIVDNGQLIDILQAKGFLQLQGNQGQRIGVVALIGIGDGNKEVQGQQMIHLGGNLLPLVQQAGSHRRKALADVNQQILQTCHLGGLAADPRLGAALAACRFLALEAKHLIV